MARFYTLMRGVSKNRLVRNCLWGAFRIIKCRAYHHWLRDNRGLTSSFFPETEMAGILLEIKDKGAVPGPKLPGHVVSEITAFAQTAKCYADRKAAHGFYLHEYSSICEKLGKNVLIAQYMNVADQLPVVNELSRDPFLLNVSAEYLRAPPKLVGVNLWWTFPVEASHEDKMKHAHYFHYDLDDVKFIKFFFYLTDVGLDDGPHVYVEKSNRLIRYKNSILRSRRFSDDEVVFAYGKDAIKVVTGKAGTSLIEDTITLHKGTTSIKNPRLILQFQYAINDYGQMHDTLN